MYLRKVARTCIFTTVFIVLIRYVIATLYLFPVLQNYEDLSIKHNIDLVSTEYPRPQNSTWLEKIFVCLI